MRPTVNLTPVFIVAGLILVLGIVHLGVGAGITGSYGQYDNIFRQSIGLSGYNIFLGIFAMGVGIFALIAVIKQNASLTKLAGISSGVLSIFALGSLIAAMVLCSQAIAYVRDHITYRMATYLQSSSSIDIMNKIQTDFQCCGVNLWLDWSRYSIGTTTGRRRRISEEFPSALVRSLRQRQRRESIYNFPSSYNLLLPLTCCKGGGVTSANNIGGICSYNSTTGVTGINVDGCLNGVANLVTSQLSAYVLINTLLVILALVLAPILIKLFAAPPDPNNPNNKNSMQNQFQQQPQQVYPQQMPPGYAEAGYVVTYSDPNNSFTNGVPVYPVYQQY